MPSSVAVSRLLYVVAAGASAVALLAVAAPGARAASCQGPPGISALDQYCEVIPSGGSGGHSGGSTVDRAVPSGTAATLAHAGHDGQLLLSLSTAARASARVRPGVKPAAAPRTARLSGIGSALTKGATAGSAFVWILVGIALSLVAMAWLRYRRPDADG
jgi:hypothetical protein